MNSNINDELREKLQIEQVVKVMCEGLPDKLSEKHDKLIQQIETFLETINSVDVDLSNSKDLNEVLSKNPILLQRFFGNFSSNRNY